MYPNPFPEHVARLAQIDAQQAQIAARQQSDASLWAAITAQLRVDWTYHSNGIEGSTLSRGETHFFLSEGLTVEGKPLKDFLDAQNHAEAIDSLFDVVANQRPISEGLVKEMNALLLRGVQSTPARNSLGQAVQKKANPGQYKTEPNHVALADGSIHRYLDPLFVSDEMAQLIAWVNTHLPILHPVHVAAVAHYNFVRIHPFDDGNGRGARMLMNLILLRQQVYPIVVRVETKRAYYAALVQADHGDLAPFIDFIMDACLTTQASVLTVLKENPQ
jgi:Fic family protein